LTCASAFGGRTPTHHPKRAGGQKFLAGMTLRPPSFLPACWKSESVFSDGGETERKKEKAELPFVHKILTILN